ncbi:MAG TPA: hypothetical protein VIV11_15985 [Kofleriaceae bacterium]
MKLVAITLLALAACTTDGLDLEVEESAVVPVAPAPASTSLSFARDTSERIKGVRIYDAAHRNPKVVYSVRLVDVQSDERLRLHGEVTLSRCNKKDIAGLSGDANQTPCDSDRMQASPYRYNPRFSAAYVLADSPTDATGRRVSPWFERGCTEGQHHCALALEAVTVDGLPDAAEKFINLVVTADSRTANARSWDVMEVEQNKGALAVTRIGVASTGEVLAVDTTELRTTTAMGIDRPEEDGDPTQVRHLIYQIEVNGVLPRDVIEADGQLRAVLGSGFTCDPLITTEIIVTKDADARQANGNHDERVTIKNGANCSDHTSQGCKYEDSGAVQLDGAPPPKLFISLVAVALRSCAAAGGGDRWRARASDGFLRVKIRR